MNPKYNPGCTSPLNAKSFMAGGVVFSDAAASGLESEGERRKKSRSMAFVGKDPYDDFFNATNYHSYIYGEVSHFVSS